MGGVDVGTSSQIHRVAEVGLRGPFAERDLHDDVRLDERDGAAANRGDVIDEWRVGRRSGQVEEPASLVVGQPAAAPA